MGWKNVKTHYGIRQFIHVQDGQILISVMGPSNIIPVIRINSDGIASMVSEAWCSDYLSHLFETLAREPDLLRTLIEKPDRFEHSIRVYTYQNDTIWSTECEQLGWPNVTHEGRLMYVHRYSPDREQVLQWATEEAKNRVADLEKEMAKIRDTFSVASIAVRDELVETRQQALSEARNQLERLIASGSVATDSIDQAISSVG